jgi:hypothetical protein
MCALVPSHAIIPADGVGGVRLQSDGSIEFVGYNALFLPQSAPQVADFGGDTD